MAAVRLKKALRNLFMVTALFSIALPFARTVIAHAEDQISPTEITAHVLKPKAVAATEERLASLQIPEGFHLEKYADGLGKPRMLAFHPSGSGLYVTRRDEGDVLFLQDQNNDGKAEKRLTAIKLPQVHGIALRDGEVFLAAVTKVYRAQIENDGSFRDLQVVMKDLPSGGQHANRTIGFAPDGSLYLSVGSTCNACDETSRESAAILRYDFSEKSRAVFASGLRNTIGFDWHPETKKLYGFDHGIDWLGDDEQKEEFNLIEKGEHYGWPYIYADGKINPVDEPGEMSSEEFREKATEPELLYTAHAAPMNFLFYTGTSFPEEYRGDGFGTMHGSWNRKPASGYKLVRVRFDNNKPQAIEPFISGFLLEDGRSYTARPCGLALGPTGNLYFSDDGNGTVYRIVYRKQT